MSAPPLRFDITTLNQYKENKALLCRKHPDLPLYIWNYSDLVQYGKLPWDEITIHCRGLVTDETGNIVARSFKKFFNWDPLKQYDDNFEVQTKLDGSLGILFFDHRSSQWIMASRGSFDSEQAVRAQRILDAKHPNFRTVLDPNRSYVFEIVYPENRIVVNYGELEAIIYLASFCNQTGLECCDRDEMGHNGFQVVSNVDNEAPITINQLKAADCNNEEGYVVKFSNGGRVKVKFCNYVEQHKLLTGLGRKTVLEWFTRKEAMSQIIKMTSCSKEVDKWLMSCYLQLQLQYYSLLIPAEMFYQIHKDKSPQEYAEAVKQQTEIPHATLFCIQKQHIKYPDQNGNTDVMHRLLCKQLDYTLLPELKKSA